MAGESIATKLAQVTKKHSNMFVAAALFNAVATICLVLPSMSTDPLPEAGFVTHLAALLVLAFGVGYYWASQDLPGNSNIILLGTVAKAAVVVMAVLDVLLGIVSWQDVVLVFGDFVFVLLFYKALQDLNKAKQE